MQPATSQDREVALMRRIIPLKSQKNQGIALLAVVAVVIVTHMALVVHVFVL
jgi:hypothetical protein